MEDGEAVHVGQDLGVSVPTGRTGRSPAPWPDSEPEASPTGTTCTHLKPAVLVDTVLICHQDIFQEHFEWRWLHTLEHLKRIFTPPPSSPLIIVVSEEQGREEARCQDVPLPDTVDGYKHLAPCGEEFANSHSGNHQL